MQCRICEESWVMRADLLVVRRLVAPIREGFGGPNGKAALVLNTGSLGQRINRFNYSVPWMAGSEASYLR